MDDSKNTNQCARGTAMRRERLQQVVDGLPDEVDLDSLLEELYLLRKIELAEKELAQGKGIPHDDAKKQLRSWLE